MLSSCVNISTYASLSISFLPFVTPPIPSIIACIYPIRPSRAVKCIHIRSSLTHLHISLSLSSCLFTLDFASVCIAQSLRQPYHSTSPRRYHSSNHQLHSKLKYKLFFSIVTCMSTDTHSHACIYRHTHTSSTELIIIPVYIHVTCICASAFRFRTHKLRGETFVRTRAGIYT